MGSPMAPVNLKVLSITCWWPLAVKMYTKLIMYLGQFSIFPVVFGKYFSDTFNLVYCLYNVDTVLLWNGGVIYIKRPTYLF